MSRPACARRAASAGSADSKATIAANPGATAEGLGGGNELVGGVWILLVSVGAWGTDRLPAGLNVLGIVSSVTALVTLVPGLSDVGIVFGLGSIAWFAWVGIVLLRPAANGIPQG